ncbi:MAG TPA: hypothetical protein VJ417_03530, partial [Candidatus Glassbacteria bacterium]|nr:hypothetical protein [Candidatus Glassbacteria bacterium]
MPIKSYWSILKLSGLISMVFAGLLGAENFTVPDYHPRLFGPQDYLKQLAAAKPLEFQRVTEVAIELEGNDHERMISQALVYAVGGDDWCAETAIASAL